MNIRVEKIAKELLLEEDCVVIPQFGGFVTHYRPAILEPSKNILIPPGKGISFNIKLSKNDGLLAQNVATKCGMTYNEALKAIEVKVSFWQKELEKSNYLELEGIGSFVLNKEGNLIFDQFNESNFANTSFGLTNVHATPIERVGLAHRIERGLNQKKATPKTYKTIKRTVTAIAAVSIGAFLFLSVSTNNDAIRNHLDLNFLNGLFSEKIEPQAKFTVGKSKAVEDKTVVVEEIAFFDEHEKQLFTDRGLLDQQEDLNQIKILQEEQKEKAKIFAKFPVKKIKKKSIKIVSPQPIKNSTISFKYHVIAGCFGVESNAGKMVLRLQKAGFPNAQLAGSSNSGLHRVSYGSYNNKVVALKALAKAKLSHNSKAWLAKD